MTRSATPAWADRLDRLLSTPWLPWLFVAFGALLRVTRYLSRHPLEVSEAAFTLNLLPRTLAQSLEPLQFEQVSPPGFVAVIIAAKQLMGPGERALRAFPQFASLAALPLFLVLSRRFLRPAGVSIAMALFAISPSVIWYSSWVKQYASDATFTIGLLILAWRALEGRRASTLAYAALGSFALWLSHPAAFVVAGTGSVLAGAALLRRDTAALLRLIPCGLLFAVSFGLLFVTAQRTPTTQRLLDYWAGGFMPFPPRSLADLRWPIDCGLGILFDEGFTPAGASAFALLVGLIAGWREQRQASVLLLSPLPFLLAASALHFYPMMHRLALFLVPILVLFIAAGADFVRRELKGTPLVGAVLLLLLFFDPLTSEAKKFLAPPRYDDPLALLEHLQQELRPEDTLWVYQTAQPAWAYYAPHYGLDPNRAIIGFSDRNLWKIDLHEIEQMRGQRRVWLLFSHSTQGYSPRAPGSEEDFMLFELDRIGRRLEEKHEPGASLYLYDLHQEAPPS